MPDIRDCVAYLNAKHRPKPTNPETTELPPFVPQSDEELMAAFPRSKPK